jgi:hypothetical protein
MMLFKYDQTYKKSKIEMSTQVAVQVNRANYLAGFIKQTIDDPLIVRQRMPNWLF